MVLAHPPAHRPAGRQAPHGHGGRHVHGHGWCLIIAIDGQTGEVLDWQWCAHESKAAYLTLFSRLPAPDVLIADGLRGAEAACTQAWPGTRIQRCLVVCVQLVVAGLVTMIFRV